MKVLPMPSREGGQLPYTGGTGGVGEETASGRVQKNKAIAPPKSKTDESKGWRFSMR